MAPARVVTFLRIRSLLLLIMLLVGVGVVVLVVVDMGRYFRIGMATWGIDICGLAGGGCVGRDVQQVRLIISPTLGLLAGWPHAQSRFRGKET